MNRHAFALVSASALLAASLGCANSNTLSPAPGADTFASSLKATAPVPVSPVHDQVLSGNTFTATPAVPQFGAIALQYRFQIFSDTGSQVLDSGLVNSPVWKTSNLTPNKRFTWKVRAEFEGTPGPWSTTASFQSGDPAPSFPGPIGDWQHCAGLAGIALSICVHDAINPKNSVGAFEVTKRIAWLARGDGAGLLIKAGGENVVLWQGYSFSASRMCFSNGQLFKVISDTGPGGGNFPDFSDNGFVIDPALCVPAIDPSKP
jgi:hypothetical protein